MSGLRLSTDTPLSKVRPEGQVCDKTWWEGRLQDGGATWNARHWSADTMKTFFRRITLVQGKIMNRKRNNLAVEKSVWGPWPIYIVMDRGLNKGRT